MDGNPMHTLAASSRSCEFEFKIVLPRRTGIRPEPKGIEITRLSGDGVIELGFYSN